MPTITSQDGTKIAFDKRGSGPAIILVGGAFQYRAFDPRTSQLADLIADAGYTVYNYDRRGRGESTNTLPYAVDHEIEDLEALIQDAGGSAMLFGMSSGAALVLHAAASGVAASKLALYEPPFRTNPAEQTAAKEYLTQLQALLAEDRRGDAVELAMTTFGTPPEMLAGIKKSPVWPLFEAIAPTLAYDGAIMGDGTIPAAILQKVTVPTLIVDGGNSPDFMHDAADQAAALLPNATRQTLEGQSHDYAAEVLAPVLIDFFKA